MLPIITSQLLGLPEGAKPEHTQRLPWANGSLLPAKIIPAQTPHAANLVMAGYRLRARLPPTISMGEVWLQLISHEMPAQFRLLNEAQAASLLIQMLHKSTTHTSDTRPAKQIQDQGWSKLDTADLPYGTHTTEEAHHLLLRDRENGNPRLVLRRSGNLNHFLLQGRADLENMGPVAFSLEGSEGQDWQLHVFAGNQCQLSPLRTAFASWLTARQEQYGKLKGKVLAGLPEDFSSLLKDIQA